ncbi:hypothetical protein DSM112329_00793 [Paraconexibacter sp. AEG42_29]|uniref:TraD/TraG TraM recognition site domain-containing protein n=2 Tax=Paraconexibacter sp. AEG42_29 TaxID=2997339 RepID=A0AAU7AQN1_9ACTN
MAALAAGVAVLMIARHARAWITSIHTQLDKLVAGATSPRTLGLAALTVAAAAGLLALRARHARRVLADRTLLQVVPPADLDPSPDAVARFASQLSRTRRRGRGWLERSAAATRITIHSDQAGRLAYEISAPRHAAAALHAALGEYPGLDLLEPQPPADTSPATGTGVTPTGGREAGPIAAHGRARWRAHQERRRVLRCELMLARPAHEPLAILGLTPDPLQPLAAALGGLDTAAGERAQVHLDVLAMTAGEARRWRRRTQRRARRDLGHHSPAPRPAGGWSSAGSDPLNLTDLLARPAGQAGGRGDVVAAAGRQHVVEGLRAKASGHGQLLGVQLLLEVRGRDRRAARSHLRALLACFDQFAAQNHWRARGLDLPGLGFTGADGPLHRRGFDQRARTGRFRPPRRNVVTAGEIAGLLKPPTKRCEAPNAVRAAGAIAPPPPGLPTFDHERHLLPLGRVRDRHGERVVGARLEDTFFSYMAGRSRYGKTELGLVQFIHLARSGRGGLFLDPHADALAEIKNYLTDEDISRRVVEVNLSGQAARERQPGWNPLAMAGLPVEAAEGKVEALVDAFASALQWDERNTRALSLTTQAAQALIELSMKVPADTAPTLFQIPTLLSNDDWRTAVLPHLSPPTRTFFEQRFPRLPAEAITPVTNLIDRLRASTPIAGLLGSSTSTYDIRNAMDDGKVVLACPGSGGTRDRLVANFLVYDLLHAAKARADVASDQRRKFYVYLDEVQTYDGASSGNLAALLEQTAKYGVRAFLFNQNPERLTAATLNAVTTNRSHLLTTTVNAKAASLLAREWGGAPSAETVTQLARYTYLASVTLGGEATKPFLVRGMPATEIHERHRGKPEDLPHLEEAIDQNTGRRSVKDTLMALDTLDARILQALATAKPAAPTARPAGKRSSDFEMPAADQDGGAR